MSQNIPRYDLYRDALNNCELIAEKRCLGSSLKTMADRHFKFNLVALVDEVLRKMRPEDKTEHKFLAIQLQSVVYGTLSQALRAEWASQYPKTDTRRDAA